MKAELVEAHGGIEVQGHLEARRVISGQRALIGRKAFWRGDLEAPALVVEERAVISPSRFAVRPARARP